MLRLRHEWSVSLDVGSPIKRDKPICDIFALSINQLHIADLQPATADDFTDRAHSSEPSALYSSGDVHLALGSGFIALALGKLNRATQDI
jgi:hypothetical protein